MRKDHHKVICERERIGSSKSYHDYRNTKPQKINDDFFDFEEGDEVLASPTRAQPMRRPYKRYYYEKDFNDFTSPIRGFIRKNVGRVWDEVFSEFCEIYDQRSVLTKHLFLHLKQHVCCKVKEVDGVLMVHTSYGVELLDKSTYVDYYVDPRDGILKYNGKYLHWKKKQKAYWKERREQETKNIRVIDKFTECHLVNDVWFKIKFIEREGYMKLHERASTYNPNTVHRWYELMYTPERDVLKGVSTEKRVAVSKTTASKKEIRDYKLNVPVDKDIAA